MSYIAFWIFLLLLAFGLNVTLLVSIHIVYLKHNFPSFFYDGKWKILLTCEMERSFDSVRNEMFTRQLGKWIIESLLICFYVICKPSTTYMIESLIETSENIFQQFRYFHVQTLNFPFFSTPCTLWLFSHDSLAEVASETGQIKFGNVIVLPPCTPPFMHLFYFQPTPA